MPPRRPRPRRRSRRPPGTGALVDRGEPVRLLDVRSDNSYLSSEQDLRDAARIRPQHARGDVQRAGVPKGRLGRPLLHVTLGRHVGPGGRRTQASGLDEGLRGQGRLGRPARTGLRAGSVGIGRTRISRFDVEGGLEPARVYGYEPTLPEDGEALRRAKDLRLHEAEVCGWVPSLGGRASREGASAVGGAVCGPEGGGLRGLSRRASPFFTSPEHVEPLVELLREAVSRHGCIAPVYCFMPDHLHAILLGLNEDARVKVALARFKQRSAYWMARHHPGVRWQKDFYDHILRPDEDQTRQVAYILNNPVRARLAEALSSTRSAAASEPRSTSYCTRTSLTRTIACCSRRSLACAGLFVLLQRRLVAVHPCAG